MDLITTIKGSLLEGFYPEGWDLARIDECCSQPPEAITDRQAFWNPDFEVVPCAALGDFDVMMGHEIAVEIRNAKTAGQKLCLILPVGPMGMYRWLVYFLKAWDVDCRHVYCFNMDEWSDADGNTLTGDDRASFRFAMEENLYNPLGELTVPVEQRNFATRENLPLYPEKIAALRTEGARLVTVYGIGRACHIAFWEPHFAAEYEDDSAWMRENYRIGAKLHPLTIEQNALTSFKSRYTLVSARANTVGPGLFFQSDRMIGGCDGVLGRGMQWQGVSLWVTLRYGPTRWITSSYVPTIPGRLFFLQELAGPLLPESN